jgi:tetratricopeptide (TPR) repeat protein
MNLLGGRGFAARTSFAATVLFFILLVHPSKAFSQWLEEPDIDARVQKGIGFIYNLEFASADSIFDQVVQIRPDHPVGYFFRAMNQWWRILTNFDDESHDERFYGMLDVVIQMCEKRLDTNPKDLTALFFKGGAVGFRGRLRANRGKWVGAANDGLVALPLVRKAFELDQNNYDVMLGIGIYNYYAEIIPDRYSIVKPLMIFFPSGDRKKGLEQLRIASEKAKYARVEATYFMLQNYLQFEKDYVKGLEIARSLHGQYPRNALFHRILGRCYTSLGMANEANAVFLEVEKKYRAKQTGYDLYDAREAYYYLGRHEFLGGRYEAALKYFYACDEISRKIDKDGPSGFMSMANLMIGMTYDAQKNRKQALAQYRKVLRMKEYEQTHIESQKYLKAPYER